MTKTVSAVTCVALILAARSSQAATFAEVGDAPSTPAAAQTTIGATPLTAITGSITSSADADVFVIRITTPSTFSATTQNPLTTAANIDTELFLFSTAGAPIATNDDDASGLYITSTLGSGNSLTASLSAGTYLLGIAVAGNQAVNANNQLVFQTGGSTTATYGAATGLNPAVYSNFNGNTYDVESGNYEIDLTSTAAAAVPEPTCGLASASLAGLLARRRLR